LAVECALKARIASKTNAFDFPELKRAQNSHQHDLEKLIETAELKSTLDAANGSQSKVQGELEHRETMANRNALRSQRRSVESTRAVFKRDRK
jgi:hypothetical protein